MNRYYFALLPMVAYGTCFLLIVVLRPWLAQYALARPNARSSHTVPTPQGAGIAVIAATIFAAMFSYWTAGGSISAELIWVFAATVFIALIGAVDDLRPIPVPLRLVLQAVAVGAVLASLPGEIRFFQNIPAWLERGLLLIAGIWFVNLVNFMDGLDWITVAEVLPITVALGAYGLWGQATADTGVVASALAGSMIAFAFFNRPIAKLFLGDVGSLPIGLLLGWCLLKLADSGHLVAAIILPLYYLADGTITLLRRIRNGEAFWVAHRSHFYQRATDNGFTVMEVVSHVFILNAALVALATMSIAFNAAGIDVVALLVACCIVASVLSRFSRQKS